MTPAWQRGCRWRSSSWDLPAVGGWGTRSDALRSRSWASVGHRLAEVRRARGLTRQHVAERMGVTKGRVSQIEEGKISGQDVVARFAAALGGRLHQAIYFDDGDITTIA
nr:helix-turn-helix transcriptional regulator [Frankia sp. Cr2]